MEEEPRSHASEAGPRGLKRAVRLLEVERRDPASVGRAGNEEVGPVLPVDVGDGGRTEAYAGETGPRGLKRAVRLLEVEGCDPVEVGISASDEEVGPVLPVHVGDGGGAASTPVRPAPAG